MDGPDLVLTLLTQDGEQAAADLVAEILEDRHLDLPRGIDEQFCNEILEAMEATIMERNEINDERREEEYAHQTFDVQAFEGMLTKHHNY